MNNSTNEETEVLFKSDLVNNGLDSFIVPGQNYNFVEIEFIEKSGAANELYVHSNGNIALKITKGDKIGIAGNEVKISITKSGSVSFSYKTSNTLTA